MPVNIDEIFGGSPKYYSTSYVAKQLKYPQVNGNIKLRNFMHQNNILINDHIAPEYRNKGLFVEEWGYWNRWKGNYYSIKVSQKGIEFLEKLIEEKFGKVKNYE